MLKAFQSISKPTILKISVVHRPGPTGSTFYPAAPPVPTSNDRRRTEVLADRRRTGPPSDSLPGSPRLYWTMWERSQEELIRLRGGKGDPPVPPFLALTPLDR